MSFYGIVEDSRNELQTLNGKLPAASAGAVALTGSVGAAAEVATQVVTQGHEVLTVVTTDLAASLTVEIYLLDAADARLGAALQTISTNAVTKIELAWPKVEIVRKNASAAAANISAHYALR